MSWKLGSQIRVATPEGDVYVAPNRIHYHNSSNHQAFFTVGQGGKNILPFIVTGEFFDDDNVGDKLEHIAMQLKYLI